MLKKLFFLFNITLLGIVFSLKTFYEASFQWFFALPWLTFFNGFIDIAIKTQVESNEILTFWILTSLIWTSFLLKQSNFFQGAKKQKSSKTNEKPLNIDELEEKPRDLSSSYTQNTELNKAHRTESAGAGFAAALSQAVSSSSKVAETNTNNNLFFDQANQALSSMTPDAAKKLKKVQTVLNDLETASKNNELANLAKKEIKS